MDIGELSARTGVNRRLLRYYEEQTLLRPHRRANGYREYAEADVATVAGIRQLLAAGLNTATIAELLPCMINRGDGLSPICPELLPDLEREREKLTEAIDTLVEARQVLERIIAAAPEQPVTSETPILTAPAG